MSYDIYIKNEHGDVIQFEEPVDIRGGTYALGGTTEAHFNITYNYYAIFRRVLGEKGIRSIYGMLAWDSIPTLHAAASLLDGEPDEDYWAATDGNAKAALLDLIRLAMLAPMGVWDGD